MDQPILKQAKNILKSVDALEESTEKTNLLKFLSQFLIDYIENPDQNENIIVKNKKS